MQPILQCLGGGYLYLVWGDNGITNANTTLISDYGVNVSINHLNRVRRVENKGVQQK